MTVSSQTSTATFVGNGVATAFPLPFRFFENGDIRAYFIDSVTGAATQMVLGTDYTLIGAGEPEVDGNALSLLTTTVPLASMRGLYVERFMPQTQSTDLVNQGEFFASTHEDVFDRLTMLIQQQVTETNKAKAEADEALAIAQEMVARQEAFENNYTYAILGPYAAGLVFTSRNQVFSYNPGTGAEFYSPGPAIVLPYTTTGAGAGEIANFRSVGDATLRSDLAGPDGVDLVGGAQRKSDDYTTVRDGLRRIASTIITPGASISGVVTGDSLSFNAFGYPGTWPVDGGGYATSNPFGLSSWAHLLRDLFTTANGAFTPIKDVDFSTSATILPGFSNPWEVGSNGRAITFNFDSGLSTSLRVRHTYSGERALIVSYAPSGSAVTFKVDGVSYSTLSPDGKYQSRGYFIVPCASAVTVIDNVAPVSGPNANLTIYGIGDQNARVPALTGKGAYTSGQVLAEYASLVGAYSPDYIFYIIGANDISSGVPVATFRANLETFIGNAKSAKPNCEIVLISTPPSSSYSRTLARTYIAAMREVADTMGASLIDLHTWLEQTDPAYYRFDNIHFNTTGDTLVFSIIRKLCFPAVEIEQEKLVPVRQMLLGVGGYYYNSRESSRTYSAVLTLGATITASAVGVTAPPVFPTGAYVGAGATSRVNVTPPPGYTINSIQSLNVDGPTGALAEIVSVSSYATVAARAAGAYVEMANTGKYLIVSYSIG